MSAAESTSEATGDHKGAVAEVWPLGVTDDGLWLLHDPWLSDRVVVGSSPGETASRILHEHLPAGVTAPFLVSTSWRDDGPNAVFTYIAVLNPTDLTQWPSPQPVTELAGENAADVKPGPAISAPQPRKIDVLLHAVRHLAHTVDDAQHDPTVATMTARLAKLGLPRHLRALKPALGGMYRTERD